MDTLKLSISTSKLLLTTSLFMHLYIEVCAPCSASVIMALVQQSCSNSWLQSLDSPHCGVGSPGFCAFVSYEYKKYLSNLNICCSTSEPSSMICDDSVSSFSPNFIEKDALSPCGASVKLSACAKASRSISGRFCWTWSWSSL